MFLCTLYWSSYGLNFTFRDLRSFHPWLSGHIIWCLVPSCRNFQSLSYIPNSHQDCVKSCTYVKSWRWLDRRQLFYADWAGTDCPPLSLSIRLIITYSLYTVPSDHELWTILKWAQSDLDTPTRCGSSSQRTNFIQWSRKITLIHLCFGFEYPVFRSIKLACGMATRHPIDWPILVLSLLQSMLRIDMRARCLGWMEGCVSTYYKWWG